MKTKVNKYRINFENIILNYMKKFQEFKTLKK